jgi:tRNA (guanine37-N1)-methyltransferase
MNSEIKIHIITLFPKYFDGFKDFGIIGSLIRGERGVKLSLNFYNPKDYTVKNYKGVDDSPYGGGAGMVMRADVLQRTLLEGIIKDRALEQFHIVHMSPRGKTWSHQSSKNLAANFLNYESQKELIFVCGRYEGIDERFIKKYVSEEISIGDFIITGAELAVQLVLDSSFRFIDGTLGNKSSLKEESFSQDMLEYPQYTRPAIFENLEVPAVLMGGNHEEIAKYREAESLRITKEKRPDLLGKAKKK